jgi:hypothetical protein
MCSISAHRLAKASAISLRARLPAFRARLPWRLKAAEAAACMARSNWRSDRWLAWSRRAELTAGFGVGGMRARKRAPKPTPERLGVWCRKLSLAAMRCPTSRRSCLPACCRAGPVEDTRARRAAYCACPKAARWLFSVCRILHSRKSRSDYPGPTATIFLEGAESITRTPRSRPPIGLASRRSRPDTAPTFRQ